MAFPAWMEVLPGWKHYHETLVRVHHKGEMREFDLPRGLHTPLEIYGFACKVQAEMIRRQEAIDRVTNRLTNKS